MSSEGDSLTGVNLDASDRAQSEELVECVAAVRRALLGHDEVASYVRSSRSRISGIDFVVAFGCLFGGAALGAFAMRRMPALIPIAVILQVAGFAGFFSLNHEGWHRRSTPWGERFFSRYVIQPIVLGFYTPQQEDHARHHRNAGEPNDPSFEIWALPEREFRHAVFTQILFVPKVIQILRRTLSGRRSNTDAARKHSHRGSVGGLVALVAFHGTWAGALLLASPWSLLTSYVVPLSCAAALGHLREYREHERLSNGSSAVYDTLCHPFERLFIAGGRFNLHALHHVFPEVPQRQLPGLHRIISGDPELERKYYEHTPRIARRRTYLARQNPEP